MQDPVRDCSPFVRLAHDYSPGADLHLRPRVICDHALLYVQQGTGVFDAGKGEETLTAGSLMCIPPYIEHTFTLRHPSAVGMLNIHYDPVIRADSEQVHWFLDARQPRPVSAPGPLFPGQGPVVLEIRPPQAYVAAFRRLARCWPVTRPAALLSQRAAMLDLLALVLRNADPLAAVGSASAALERARRHLEESPGKVRLAEIAELAQMGRSAFTAAFTRNYGLSPMAYRRQARIERAKADLVWGGMPVKAVARRAGFTSVPHFTRIFSQLVGEPPATYAARTARPS